MPGGRSAVTKHRILPTVFAVALVFPMGHATVQAGERETGASSSLSPAPHPVQPAEYNNLNKFRDLQPGSRLVIPPLVTPGQVGKPSRGALTHDAGRTD